MSGLEQAFAEAMEASGLPCPIVPIADGGIHRFAPVGDDRRSNHAWYVLYGDGIPAGSFGSWRTGQSEKWCARDVETLTKAEQAEHRRRMVEVKAERDRARLEAQVLASERAQAIWADAKSADPEHPYLVKKGIQPHGLRQVELTLLVPVRDGEGRLWNLQRIQPNGVKRFLPEARVTGLYTSIGKRTGTICIAEGFATAASIHQATGWTVAAAFTCHNLETVTKGLREKYPEANLVLAADNDQFTDDNPGVATATESAKAVRAGLAIPTFADTSDHPTDFNDLHRLEGLEVVREQLNEGKVEDAIEHQPPVAYRRLADIEAEPIRWLWPGRVARGKVVVIAGNPGLGKSQVTISMAATVSTGGSWPVDHSRCEKGSAIFITCEDDPADTIRPRLEAAGADLERVYILDAVRHYDTEGGSIERTFNLKDHLAHLERMLDEVGDVVLVVIDPVSAYLGATDSHKNADVRALLAPLSEMAARRGVAIVMVSHLNKGGGSDALARFTGSFAFVAAARGAFVVSRDPEDSERRLFIPAKNNIGKDNSGLSFKVESHTLCNGIETSRVVWGADPVTVSADEALAQSTDPGERSATDEAIEWLQEELKLGPKAVSVVQQEARKVGVSDKALRRARERLGVKPKKREFSGGWEWRLPVQDAPQGAQDAQVSRPQN
jgi:putative DNA primase/helicase